MKRKSEDDGWAFVGQISATGLGVYIGVLAAILTWEWINAHRLEQAAKVAQLEMEKSLRKLHQDEKQRAELTLRQQQNEAAKTAAQQSVLRAVEKERREKEERRELAWQRFYQPSAACLHDSASTICANQFIAAQKAFKAQYQDQ